MAAMADAVPDDVADAAQARRSNELGFTRPGPQSRPGLTRGWDLGGCAFQNNEEAAARPTASR